MICTQTQQQLSLRDPARGRGNPFSRPRAHAGRSGTGHYIQPQDKPICMIADDMHPNTPIPVIAGPRKGSWQSVLPSFVPLEGVPRETLGRFPRALFAVTVSGNPYSRPLSTCRENGDGSYKLRDPVRAPGPAMTHILRFSCNYGSRRGTGPEVTDRHSR